MFIFFFFHFNFFTCPKKLEGGGAILESSSINKQLIFEGGIIHVFFLIVLTLLHNTYCKPNFICVQKNFARFARASMSRIFLAAKQSSSVSDNFKQISLILMASLYLVTANHIAKRWCRELKIVHTGNRSVIHVTIANYFRNQNICYNLFH